MRWAEGDVVVARHPQLWRHYLPEALVPTELDQPLPDGTRRVWLALAHDLTLPRRRGWSTPRSSTACPFTVRSSASTTQDPRR